MQDYIKLQSANGEEQLIFTQNIVRVREISSQPDNYQILINLIDGNKVYAYISMAEFERAVNGEVAEAVTEPTV